MAKISMRSIREIRNLIYQGYSIKEVASIYKISETTVRNYTREIRKRMSEGADNLQLSMRF